MMTVTRPIRPVRLHPAPRGTVAYWIGRGGPLGRALAADRVCWGALSDPLVVVTRVVRVDSRPEILRGGYYPVARVGE